MPKHVLVALPLSDAQRSALQASVPEYEFIFAQTETVTLAQVLEADIIMGNDLVALSLPGTPETLHMFDAARLARCKQGAILLNVGRGSTVDCLALADAVHSGHLFGAALDVTDPEPLPSDHPLWSEPNVIITPHISGRFSLAKTLDNIVEIFIHNLKLYAAGQPVDNQVSRTTHYVSGGSGGQRLVCGMP